MKLEDRTIPIHRLSKQKLVWMANHVCQAHRHSYLSHYACYWKEHPDKERVGFLDIECVIPGTLILTRDGLKPIETITSNDYVLTHTNRWKKVTSIMSRKIDEEVVSVGDGHTPVLTLTKKHPMYMVNLKESTKRGVFDQQRGMNINRLDIPEWRNAETVSKENTLLVGLINSESWKNITTIEIGEPSSADHHYTSNIKSILKITDTFLKVIGLFIGDGCATNGTIEFFSGEKDEEFRQIIRDWAEEIGATNLVEKQEGNMWRQRICSSRLARFFKQFYNESGNKTIPIEWLNIDDNNFSIMLSGLLLADGHQYKSNKCSLSTTSKELMERLVIRTSHSNNFRVRYYKYKSNPTTIKGRAIQSKPYYALCFYTDDYNSSRHSRQWRMFDYILKRPMYSEYAPYKGLVYNLSVEEDESYIANGFIVHNCSNLDADFGIMLSYCIKKAGSKEILEGVLTAKDIKKAKIGCEDARIVRKLIEDLNQFDRIVTFYGRNFDIPFVRARALICGISFPNYGSVLHTDVYFIMRSRFKLSSKRLENCCRVLLGKTNKTRINNAFWRGAVRGCKKALDYVVTHNRFDVIDLEKLYNKVINFARKSDQSL